MYKFYYTCDFIVLDSILYTFNLNFEKLFNIEKTKEKVKKKILKSLKETGFLEQTSTVDQYFDSISVRYFVTPMEERITSLNNNVFIDLGLEINQENKCIISNEEDAEKLIKYLTGKTIKEDRSNKIYEVTGQIKELQINK